MPLTIGEAVESAKSFILDRGFLTQGFYEQLVDGLVAEDHYAFTINLADMGIQVKRGNVGDAVWGVDRRLQEVRSGCKEPSRRARLKKVMQRMVESPGGLWMPSTWEDDEPPPEEEYVSFMPGADEVELSEEDIEESWTPEEYEEKLDIDEAKEILEDVGISIDSEGNIDFYQSNIPGIYTERGRMRSIPLETMVHEYERRLSMLDKQQGELDKLQDTLASLSTDYDNLLSINYRSFSRIPEISEIGGELEEAAKVLEPVVQRIDEMHGQVDAHYQGLYESRQDYEKLLGALQKAEGYKEEDPQKFQEFFTKGFGGLAAMLLKLEKEAQRWQGSSYGEGEDTFFYEISLRAGAELLERSVSEIDFAAFNKAVVDRVEEFVVEKKERGALRPIDPQQESLDAAPQVRVSVTSEVVPGDDFDTTIIENDRDITMDPDGDEIHDIIVEVSGMYM